MMIRLALFAALIAAPVLAQEFSENSKARSWNLYAEQPALFEARVVDVLCELTGDCPADCGAGKRQMGLVRSADNVLVAWPTKLSLAPHLGQEIEAALQRKDIVPTHTPDLAPLASLGSPPIASSYWDRLFS